MQVDAENLMLGAYRRPRAAKRTQLIDDLDRVYATFPIPLITGSMPEACSPSSS